MKRIIAQARKELTQTFRDKLTVALALVLPLILIVLIGAAISLSVKNVPVTVQDFDRTPLSRRYLDAVRTSITFRVVSVSIDQQPDEALVAEHARAAIVIPKNFEQDFLRGQTAEVQWLIDATDSNTANALRGSASSITRPSRRSSTPAIASRGRNRRSRPRCECGTTPE